MVQRITITALTLALIGTITAEAQAQQVGSLLESQVGSVISVFEVRDIEPPAMEVWANADAESDFMEDSAIALMLGRKASSVPALTGQDSETAARRRMADDSSEDGVFVGQTTDLELRVPEDSGFDLIVHQAQEFTVERISEALAGVFRTTGGLNFTIIGTSGLGDRFLAGPGNDS